MASKLPRQYHSIVTMIKKVFDGSEVEAIIEPENFQVLFTVTNPNFTVRLDLHRYTYQILYGQKIAKCGTSNVLKQALITLSEHLKTGADINDCPDVVKKIQNVKKGRTNIGDFSIPQELLDVLNESPVNLSSASDKDIATVILLYRFMILLNRHIKMNSYIIFLTGKIKDWYQLGFVPTLKQKEALLEIVTLLKPVIDMIDDEIMTENYWFITSFTTT